MDEHGDATEMERYLKNVGHWHAYLTTVAQRAEEKKTLEARAAALKPEPVKVDITPEPVDYSVTYAGHATDPVEPPKPNRRLGIGSFKR